MKEEKIYLVIEEDCFDFENNQNITVFKEYKDAVYFVQKRIDEILNNDDYLDFDTVNKTPTRLEMYNEGEYNENHYNIEIYIKEVN